MGGDVSIGSSVAGAAAAVGATAGGAVAGVAAVDIDGPVEGVVVAIGG